MQLKRFRIVLKKTPGFKVMTSLCFVVITLFVATGCDKSETPPTACNMDNPLTDLPWLKAIVDGFEYDAVTLGYNPHARIYQCAYTDGVGFLLEMCVGCPDAGYSFRNCEGVVLCGGGGLSGEDNCSKLNIDFENKNLIWEFFKNDREDNSCKFENPLTDLLWLKEIIDEFNLWAQASLSLSIAIYQCQYGNAETGFLVDEGNTKPFYNCNGEIVCIMGGHAGETCSELNIVSEELIWAVEKTTENDISACGVNNPLQNIEWLKEYCKSRIKTQDFSSVRIYLYKVIDTDEHIFCIVVPSPIEYAPNRYYSTLYFRDCNGDTVFRWETVTPPGGPYRDFMKDKEFIIELFHFDKQ